MLMIFLRLNSQFVDELKPMAVGFNNGSFTGTSTHHHTHYKHNGRQSFADCWVVIPEGMWVVVMSTATTIPIIIRMKVNAYTVLSLTPLTVLGTIRVGKYNIPSCWNINQTETRNGADMALQHIREKPCNGYE